MAIIKKIVIINYFILAYFQLCEVIVYYFWLLNDISPYVIIGYFRLHYHKLFGYFIGGYY
jgi:hypothetical protein